MRILITPIDRQSIDNAFNWISFLAERQPAEGTPPDPFECKSGSIKLVFTSQPCSKPPTNEEFIHIVSQIQSHFDIYGVAEDLFYYQFQDWFRVDDIGNKEVFGRLVLKTESLLPGMKDLDSLALCIVDAASL